MTQRTTTLVGFGAVVLWSLLAVLTTATGSVPPFQLAAMTFVIGGGLGALSWTLRPGAAASLRQPVAVWVLGIGGLFGYHALYFMALRLAPPAEAGLIKTVAAENAIAVVQEAVALCGNHALARSNPLERHLRDVLCARIHTPQPDSAYGVAGRRALGAN